MDVKKISPDMVGGREEKALFSEFVEDYNTSTLPHEKYYDLAAWDKQELERQEKRLAKLKGKQSEAKVDLKADEERLR